MNEITATALKPLLTDGAEIAFLDVREYGQYGEGHPFFSVNVPFSQLEFRAPALMPNRNVRCVIMDDGDDVSLRAVRVLESLGYRKLSVLSGGAPAWVDAGFTLFKGVNLPSKAFGEIVEHELGTESVSAEQLNEMLESSSRIVLLDGRTQREFRKMSLPYARSCPNADLGYYISALCPDPETPIVINCAGRTRSIIGSENLRLLNIPNPVYALRNGTQGWELSGLELRHGAEITPLPRLDDVALGDVRAQAAELCRDYDLSRVSLADVQAWMADDGRTTYLFDVRSRDEYLEGHAVGARSAPGGQLVQATDEQLAVRNSRIVLSCDTGLRAATTAVWLRGMGHQVWILDPDTPLNEADFVETVPEAIADTIDLGEMKRLVDEGALVLDASASHAYQAGHIDGAVWVTRARLNVDEVQHPEDVVLTGDPVLMTGIREEFLAQTGKAPQYICQGDRETWECAGLTVVSTPDVPSKANCIDYLFFVHDRHDGNLDAARRYLEWETGLMDQMDAQEIGVLKPLRPSSEIA